MSSLFANSVSSPKAKPPVRYQAVNPLAVASVVAGSLSILTAFGSTVAAWLLLATIPVAGILLGWRALRQIRKAPEVWTGLRLAWVGIGLSAGLWTLGCAWLAFADVSEVPYGYRWVVWDTIQPDPSKPTEPIPQTALDMQDSKIYIKGYMQPRRQQAGIKDFILCPANGDCPFCVPNPARTQMIRVTLQGDMETTYTTHLIGVAGRFRVDADDLGGIPYSIDVDVLR